MNNTFYIKEITNCYIDNIKEQEMTKEETGIGKFELKNNKGGPYKVVNFTVISNDEAKKVFHNCSAYEDKAKIL